MAAETAADLFRAAVKHGSLRRVTEAEPGQGEFVDQHELFQRIDLPMSFLVAGWVVQVVAVRVGTRGRTFVFTDGSETTLRERPDFRSTRPATEITNAVEAGHFEALLALARQISDELPDGDPYGLELDDYRDTLQRMLRPGRSAVIASEAAAKLMELLQPILDGLPDETREAVASLVEHTGEAASPEDEDAYDGGEGIADDIEALFELSQNVQSNDDGDSEDDEAEMVASSGRPRLRDHHPLEVAGWVGGITAGLEQAMGVIRATVAFIYAAIGVLWARFPEAMGALWFM